MINLPAKPTAVGQRVRFIGYGGTVRQWMVGAEGTVVRFTDRDNPVVMFNNPNYSPGVHTVTDPYGCAVLIDDEGRLVRVAAGNDERETP